MSDRKGSEHCCDLTAFTYLNADLRWQTESYSQCATLGKAVLLIRLGAPQPAHVSSSSPATVLWP
jgi:hypothetical protein